MAGCASGPVAEYSNDQKEKKTMKKTMTVLAALALSTAVQAAGPVEGYGQIGFTDSSGYDDGLALKLGADFEKNLGGVKGLGLTAFYAHWEGDHSYPWGVKGDISANVLAFGPTYDLPLPNTKWIFQGRALVTYTRVTADVCTPFGCASGSDSEIEILNLGLGAAYKLNNQTSLRLDYDMLDGADILTFGVGMKF